MKKIIFILIGSLAIAGAYQFGTRDAEVVVPEIQQPTVVERERVQPLQHVPVVQAPVVQIPVSHEPAIQPTQTPEIVDEPNRTKTPVLPVEDRGDAMLSEIDMLGGTPFDQSITMPFD